MANKDIFDDKKQPDSDKSLPIIGIDLGTAYSCMGVWKDGKVNIIPNEIGQNKDPLYIAFTDTDILFGDTAKNQIYKNPKNTIFDITKLIGKNFYDYDIKENIKYWPFEIIKDPNSDNLLIKVTYKKQEKKYTPIEILTMLLEKMKKRASDFLGQEIKDVIITFPVIPLYRPYISAIKKACRACGLNPLKFLNNTKAAVYAYTFNITDKKKERNVLIIDIGSHNLEISLSNIEDNLIEIISRIGNSSLGGEELDKRLVEYCIEEFQKKTGIDIRANEKALWRLFKYCEKAKRILSTTNQTTIEIESLMEGKDLIIDITRTKFEDLCINLFKKLMADIEKVLKDAKKSKSEVNEIILVGGSSRIPKIKEMIQSFFGEEIAIKKINPDEYNAIGSVILGDKNKHKITEDIICFDVTNFSLGIETIGGVFHTIIPRNSQIPQKKQHYLQLQLIICHIFQLILIIILKFLLKYLKEKGS